MIRKGTTRGEHTREEIVNSAMQLFIEHGFHGTSMREIAQKAGVALGGIYNHFPSKEDLFMAILVDHHPANEILPILKAAEGENLEELIHYAAREIASKYNQRLDFINLMFIELVEFRGRHVPQLFEMVFPQVMDFAVRALQERKELRPIPIPIILRAFLGLFFSYVITELMVKRQMMSETDPESLDYFVDIFLHGILAT